MAGLSVVGSLYGGEGTPDFSGVTDFEFYEKNGQLFLFVASEGTSDLQMYYVYGDQTLRYRDVQDFTEETGTFAVSDIDVIQIDGKDYILTSGRYDDNASLVAIVGNTPQITFPENITGNASDYANFTRTLVVVIAGNTYVLASKRGDNHLYTYLVQEDGQFIEKTPIADDDIVTLGDITDFASIEINGTTFIAVTSAFDGGVSLYKMGQHGNLTLRDTVTVSDGTGISYPQDVAFIGSGENQYLIMISAGSSSVTVYKLGENGHLKQTDHLIDTLDTRFEGASNLAVISHDGRSFVFVTGNDDGLSVFELLPDGTLLFALSFADNFDVSLTNVGAITVKIIDNEIHVFVSGAEDGITQFVFDPDLLGGSFTGTTEKDVITGTQSNDHLFGGRRGDILNGKAGADRLDGGGGKDYLYGGTGADVFVFEADGRKDFIMDFQDGLDLIDLSGYHQIGLVDDLVIKTRAWGVLIEVRGEKIKVIAYGENTITAEDFSVDDFIF